MGGSNKVVLCTTKNLPSHDISSSDNVRDCTPPLIFGFLLPFMIMLIVIVIKDAIAAVN